MRIRLLASFLLGALCGAMLAASRVASRLDGLVVENRQLAQQLQESQWQVERLEEQLRKRSRPTVTGAEVVVMFRDPVVRLALEQEARRVVQDLIGREVATLDPLLVMHRLDGRVVTVESRPYLLQTRAVGVAPRLRLLLEARPLVLGD